MAPSPSRSEQPGVRTGHQVVAQGSSVEQKIGVSVTVETGQSVDLAVKVVELRKDVEDLDSRLETVEEALGSLEFLGRAVAWTKRWWRRLLVALGVLGGLILWLMRIDWLKSNVGP